MKVYVVLIGEGIWLCPGRCVTTNIQNATKFETEQKAIDALEEATWDGELLGAAVLECESVIEIVRKVEVKHELRLRVDESENGTSV